MSHSTLLDNLTSAEFRLKCSVTLQIGILKTNKSIIEPRVVCPSYRRHPMRIASLADVKARLSAYIEQCETEGPIVITRNGKAVAVLLAPADDDDLEGLLLAGRRASKAC